MPLVFFPDSGTGTAEPFKRAKALHILLFYQLL